VSGGGGNVDITNLDLDELGRFEYSKLLKNALYQDRLWEVFAAPEHVDRTREELIELKGNIEAQINKWGNERPGWRPKARRLIMQIDIRLGLVKRIIADLNREESATVEAAQRKWAGFAFALAIALESTSSAHILDELELPRADAGETITARDWIEARRAQQVDKAWKQQQAVA